MKKPITTITVEESAARLDIFLAAKQNVSRSQIQKLLDQDLVMVNDKLPKKAGDKIKAGDVITIHEPSATIVKAQKTAAKIAEAKIPEPIVVAETADYIVINKPSGLLVHPTQANEKNTLTAWLVKKYPGLKKVGDNPTVRPGIVHRLDKEASGLMVVARTQKMFEHLKGQFKSRTVAKEYIALVHGRIAKDWDEIAFPIARGENNDRMAARPLAKAKYVSTLAEPEPETDDEDEEMAPGEKAAHTEFFVEQRFVNFTLLRVIIHTGRMHQIRVHMLAYNAPLVGDPLYFQKKQKRTWDECLGRLFLHSTTLAFTDLDGNKQTFSSTMPGELQKFLTQLA